jgi:hypothetical protein
LVVKLLLAFDFGLVDAVAFAVAAFDVFGVLNGGGRSDETAVNATDERICAQTVRAVNGVIALSGGQEAGDVGALLEINPEAAHRIMDAGEDFHGDMARVVADEHFVNF